MKRLLLTSTFAVLSLIGCGKVFSTGTTKTKSTPPASDTATQPSAQELSVQVGKDFVIELEENATTGYKWSVSQIDGDSLKLKSREFIAPTSTALGAPGKVKLTFTALKVGESALILDLKRSAQSNAAETKVFKIISKNQSANDNSIVIECLPPVGLAGNAARVSGAMSLTEHPEYPNTPAKVAKGELSITIGGSTLRPVLDLKKEFLGQYDDLNGSKYITAGVPLNPEIVVYMNLSAKDQSYVEYQGTRYKMNCVR